MLLELNFVSTLELAFHFNSTWAVGYEIVCTLPYQVNLFLAGCALPMCCSRGPSLVYDTRLEVFESYTSGRIQIVSFVVDAIRVPFDDFSLRSFMILIPIQEQSLRCLDKDLCPLVRFREQSNSNFHIRSFKIVQLQFPQFSA